jgi:hypothetical protein
MKYSVKDIYKELELIDDEEAYGLCLGQCPEDRI